MDLLRLDCFCCRREADLPASGINSCRASLMSNGEGFDNKKVTFNKCGRGSNRSWRVSNDTHEMKLAGQYQLAIQAMSTTYACNSYVLPRPPIITTPSSIIVLIKELDTLCYNQRDRRK